MTEKIMLGFDLIMYQQYSLKIPIYAPLSAHYIVVGGSGSVNQRLYCTGCTKPENLKVRYILLTLRQVTSLKVLPIVSLSLRTAIN